MQWSKTPGTVSVRITAAKQGVRAGTVSTQYIDSAAQTQSGKLPSGGGGHRRLLYVAIVVAGAAGAGLAAGSLRGSKTTSAPPVQPTTTIGTPTVIVGAP
jgi:hypothetical protein